MTPEVITIHLSGKRTRRTTPEFALTSLDESITNRRKTRQGPIMNESLPLADNPSANINEYSLSPDNPSNSSDEKASDVNINSSDSSDEKASDVNVSIQQDDQYVNHQRGSARSLRSDDQFSGLGPNGSSRSRNKSKIPSNKKNLRKLLRTEIIQNKNNKLMGKPSFQISWKSCNQRDKNLALQDLIESAIENPKLWDCYQTEELIHEAFNDEEEWFPYAQAISEENHVPSEVDIPKNPEEKPTERFAPVNEKVAPIPDIPMKQEENPSEMFVPVEEEETPIPDVPMKPEGKPTERFVPVEEKETSTPVPVSQLQQDMNQVEQKKKSPHPTSQASTVIIKRKMESTTPDIFPLSQHHMGKMMQMLTTLTSKVDGAMNANNNTMKRVHERIEIVEKSTMDKMDVHMKEFLDSNAVSHHPPPIPSDSQDNLSSELSSNNRNAKGWDFRALDTLNFACKDVVLP